MGWCRQKIPLGRLPQSSKYTRDRNVLSVEFIGIAYTMSCWVDSVMSGVMGGQNWRAID